MVVLVHYFKIYIVIIHILQRQNQLSGKEHYILNFIQLKQVEFDIMLLLEKSEINFLREKKSATCSSQTIIENDYIDSHKVIQISFSLSEVTKCSRFFDICVFPCLFTSQKAICLVRTRFQFVTIQCVLVV